MMDDSGIYDMLLSEQSYSTVLRLYKRYCRQLVRYLDTVFGYKLRKLILSLITTRQTFDVKNVLSL